MTFHYTGYSRASFFIKMNHFFEFDEGDEDSIPWWIHPGDDMAYNPDLYDMLGLDEIDESDYDYDAVDEWMDWFDSDDDDSEFSENEDHNKIFITLEDSKHVLKNLCFHKAINDGKLRLPRCRKKETYESTYRVLEELEFLLKTWYKRTKHNLTAHLSRKDEEAAGASKADTSSVDQELRLGMDYESNDFAYESDDELGHYCRPKHQSVNETLTKKKYCQSTKMFYEIFESEQVYKDLLTYVYKVKKCVFDRLFANFINLLPDEKREKLPNEIWEVILKKTQHPYSENREETFNVGINAESEEATRLHQDRITDLFGAAGNLHMLVFETLFKHAYITMTPAMMALDSVDMKHCSGRKVSYLKSLFQRFRKNLEMAAFRFSHMDEIKTVAEDLGNVNLSGEDEQHVDNLGSIQRGRFTIAQDRLPLAKELSNKWLKDYQFVVTSSTYSPVIAILDQVKKADGQCYLKVLLWDVEKKRPVATIDTGSTVLETCCGNNQNMAQLLFAIGRDRFGFMDRQVSSTVDRYVIKNWKFDSAWNGQELGPKDCQKSLSGVLAHDTEACESSGMVDKTIVSLKCTELEGRGTVFVMSHQNPYSQHSSVFVLDPQEGEIIKECTIEFPERIVTLECVKGSRAIVKDEFGKQFIFVNLEPRSDPKQSAILASYSTTDLCKDASHEHSASRFPGCVYEAKMDASPGRNEFVIFSQNLTCYQLFKYETEVNKEEASEFDPLVPEVVASGSTMVYEMSWRMLNKVCLNDGVLYAVPSCDVYLRTHIGDFYRDQSDVFGVGVYAFNLMESPAFHPIASFLQANSDMGNLHEIVLTNEYSRRLLADPMSHQYPFFINDSQMVMPMQRALMRFQFHSSFKAVNAIETDQLTVAHEKEVAAERRKQELARKKHEKQLKRAQQEKLRKEKKANEEKTIREKYIAQNAQLNGKITNWKGSYGFIVAQNNPGKPDTKKIGTVFVHISDFVNRGKRHVKAGQRVAFKVAKADDGRYKAVEVEMLPYTNQKQT